ncbi:lymphocyte antigen 6D-like [Asterias rubens]|uniref:lymphocyte antigen 6D-like n=1 Tax=Asterias rubens TaxID=7604 RepID=UPI0014555EBE|nr:lymphocyte antigen 6D-like [Asterias rubens]
METNPSSQRLVVWMFIFAATIYFAQGNLRCYDCDVDFKTMSNPDLNCIHNVINSTGDVMYEPRDCQPHERFCKTHIVKGNRVIKSFERDCADTCTPSCDTRGFGIDVQTCTFCCGTDGCNNSSSSAQPHTWNTFELGVVAVVAYKFAGSPCN